METTIQSGLYFSKTASRLTHPQICIPLMQHRAMREKDKSTFGDRLKRERKAQNLTQDALATLAKTSQQVISNIERNGQDKTGATVAIAKALGVNPEWLETGKGDKSPVQWELLLDIEPLDPTSQAAAKQLIAALIDGKISKEKFVAFVNLLASDLKGT